MQKPGLFDEIQVGRRTQRAATFSSWRIRTRQDRLTKDDVAAQSVVPPTAAATTEQRSSARMGGRQRTRPSFSSPALHLKKTGIGFLHFRAVIVVIGIVHLKDTCIYISIYISSRERGSPLLLFDSRRVPIIRSSCCLLLLFSSVGNGRHP